MAQPKGYAAFILFPHLKMIPLDGLCAGLRDGFNNRPLA